MKFKYQIKNHYQPLQALYYDKAGKLQSFHVNCYAGGFPNLTWNNDSSFNTFIPKILTPLDTLVPLKKHLEFLNPTSLTQEVSLEQYDHVIIVHWSRMMGRQSKRLIQLVQENAKLAKADEKVIILYVNDDDIQAR